MREKRKIIVYIATSADGYIARPDGSVEWLERPRPKGNYGMGKFMNSVDTIIWGRKTYDQALKWTKGKGMGTGPGIKNYVFSHRPPKVQPPFAEFVREPIKSFARRIRSQAGKNIWMMGGGGVIASFLDEGAIDEFRIHVIPVFIGEGIPLVQPRHRMIRLKLKSSKPFPDGVVRLEYLVLPKRAAKTK